MKDDDILERIGLNITIIRERRGLTQEKLVALADLHKTYIGQIKSFRDQLSSIPRVR